MPPLPPSAESATLHARKVFNVAQVSTLQTDMRSHAQHPLRACEHVHPRDTPHSHAYARAGGAVLRACRPPRRPAPPPGPLVAPRPRYRRQPSPPPYRIHARAHALLARPPRAARAVPVASTEPATVGLCFSGQEI